MVFLFILLLCALSTGMEDGVMEMDLEHECFETAVPNVIKSLDDHQFPTSCEDAKFLVVGLGGNFEAAPPCNYQGMWGKVQRVASLLGWAVANGRTLVFQGSDAWLSAEPSVCPGRAWDCYFSPPSNCSVADAELRGSPPPSAAPQCPFPGATAATKDEPVVWASACMHENKRCGSLLPNDHNRNDFFGSNFLPPTLREGEDNDEAALRWEARLTRYLVRPSHRVLKYITRVRANLVWPEGDVIGVHVRRGDKYPNEEDVSAFEEYYLPLVKEISEKTGAWNVFVATDSPNIIEALASRPPLLSANTEGLRFMVVSPEKDALPKVAQFNRDRKLGRGASAADASNWKFIKGNGKATGPHVTANSLASIRDVWLLGKCAHFVGTETSAVSRTAHKLLLGRLYDEQDARGEEGKLASMTLWAKWDMLWKYA